MRLTRLALAAAIAAPTAAMAAGGPHVVDDSEVEDAGKCHVESWVIRRSPTTAVLDLSPACTPSVLPWLEIGAAATYGPGQHDYGFGPALKATLRSSKTGLGLAFDVTANFSHATNRFETAGVIIPLTWKLSDTIDLNANAGWLYTRTGSKSALFTGLQAMWQARKTLGLMVEAFDRTDGVVGGQAGVRWTPVERLDIDLLASHGFDGTAHANFTLGATLRFGGA